MNSIAQRIVQVECTRMHTWDFECTEDGNQSYIGSRRQKCVLVRIRVHSTCNIICADLHFERMLNPEIGWMSCMEFLRCRYRSADKVGQGKVGGEDEER